MPQSEYRPLPEEVRGLIEEYRRAAGPCGECLKCPAACCEISGLATIANVFAACDLYARGWLSRQFTPGLEPKGFAITYFDTVAVTPAEAPGVEPYLAFFPRSLVGGQTLVCLSPIQDSEGRPRALTLSEYEAVRHHHREINAQYSWRCVFASSEIPRGDVPGRTRAGCLLHAEESGTHLTAKPLDCVLRTCRTPPELVAPEAALYRSWLEALGRLGGASRGR